MDFISTSTVKDQNTGQGQLPNNLFDCLPNCINHNIFKKVQDVKTFICCFSLNKGFASIISQFDAVSVSFVLPCQHNNDNNSNDNNNLNEGNAINIVKSTINYLITNFVATMTPPPILYASASEYFPRIKHLHLELHNDGIEDVMPKFLKRKATYGSKLKTCTMLYARQQCQLATSDTSHVRTTRKPLSVAYEFRSPMKWLKSCMTIASERQRLVKHVVAKFPTLEMVTIIDLKRWGRFYTVEGDVRDLRESLKQECTLWELLKRECASMKHVKPKLLLRLWHAYLLELPTLRCDWIKPMLFVIEPVGGNEEMVPLVEENEGDGGGLDSDSEEKALFAEAQREIMIANQSLNRTLDLFNVRTFDSPMIEISSSKYTELQIIKRSTEDCHSHENLNQLTTNLLGQITI